MNRPKQEDYFEYYNGKHKILDPGICDAYIDALEEYIDYLEKIKTTMSKTLNVTSSEDGGKKLGDVEVYGNPDLWVLICKASSKKEGWMKSTKAMDVGNGCLVQVTTQQGNQVSEALTYVPRVKISEDRNGNLYLEGYE